MTQQSMNCSEEAEECRKQLLPPTVAVLDFVSTSYSQDGCKSVQVLSESQQSAGDRHAAIAHRLALQYTILQEPAMHNIRYSHALKAGSAHTCLCFLLCSRKVESCAPEGAPAEASSSCRILLAWQY